ncbi:hypothetical protein [Acidovorax sp. M2(2025)]|uniref:hypothetical protein n=1 Tax=Acidovorax sp. M2(2025) TaxID=3411355 RepID=UPI003BF4F809
MPTVVRPLSPAARHGAALQRAEWGLVAALAVLLALAVWGPALAPSPHQHDFADQRTWWGLPCALDVLSNLPFAAAGVAGLVWLHRLGTLRLCGATRATAGLFFGGLLLAALGSTVYHWKPSDAGLLWDRVGMAVAFAGLLGWAAVGRISPRAGVPMALGLLVAGPAAVGVWAHTGNLLPWAVVQMGGMAVVLALAWRPHRHGALALPLGAVIAWYAAAKVLEGADHVVFEATGHWVSGHTLKHLVAAGAAWPLLRAMARLHHSRYVATPQAHGRMQNGGHRGARR